MLFLSILLLPFLAISSFASPVPAPAVGRSKSGVENVYTSFVRYTNTQTFTFDHYTDTNAGKVNSRATLTLVPINGLTSQTPNQPISVDTGVTGLGTYYTFNVPLNNLGYCGYYAVQLDLKYDWHRSPTVGLSRPFAIYVAC